ncbi:MAG: bL35 family ribosomal protein [Patescibacteria group bacterium]|nr:bL35 family ribosomal protein [Patescibacteria group bacterium]
MPKLKTNKTAAKRFRKTKPRGGKGAKIMFNKSKQGHLRTKKSTRQKNRTLKSHSLTAVDHKRINKLLG